MGWCRGGEILDKVWESVEGLVADPLKPEVAKKLIDVFEAYDCDVIQETIPHEWAMLDLDYALPFYQNWWEDLKDDEPEAFERILKQFLSSIPEERRHDYEQAVRAILVPNPVTKTP